MYLYGYTLPEGHLKIKKFTFSVIYDFQFHKFAGVQIDVKNVVKHLVSGGQRSAVQNKETFWDRLCTAMGMLTFQFSRAVRNAFWDRQGANKVSSVVRCYKYSYISRIRAKFSSKSH